MSWQNPKTNWTAADGVRDTDLNRIEGNILELYVMSAIQYGITVYVSTSGNDASGTGLASAPYRTIGRALESVPRNLNGKTALISIAAGTYAEHVVVSGYNDGILILGGEYGDTVTINSLEVSGSICEIRDISLSVVSGGIAVIKGSTLLAYTDIQVSGSMRGLHLLGGSRFRTDSLLTVNGSSAAAVQVSGASMAYLYDLAGSDNENAIISEEGSLISYRSTSISVNVAGYITRSGGRIYTGAQASMPNY